jgi:uncharacterized repeat protein (TIGR01451 family)
MYKFSSFGRFGLIAGLALAATAAGQSSSDRIAIRAIAEVETQGKLVAADRVVSGDHVLYTLEVRNTGATTVTSPTIVFPIPAHTLYLADSAVGPASEVTFSADAGHSFDRPENLRTVGPDGQLHTATAADYTHIRWQLKNSLKSNSVAFVRFRAVVK